MEGNSQGGIGARVPNRFEICPFCFLRGETTMKPGQTVVINSLSPDAVQALVRLSKLTAKDFGGLANCSPTSLSFFQVLAAHPEGADTSQIAAEMHVSTRSIGPLICAMKQRLRAVGDSFERYVVREVHFHKAKPYSRYWLTDEARRQLARM